MPNRNNPTRIKINTLSDSDLVLLRRVLERERNQRQNTNRRGAFTDSDDDQLHQAPEVYLAKAPSGGIPARDGTTPGSAECTIQKMTGDPRALATASFTHTVRNYGSAIPPDVYFLAARDKYRDWFALPSPPKTYVALTGTYGIPAIIADAPGSASVDLYYLDDDDTLTAWLDADSNQVTVTAYNIGPAVAGDTYIIVQEDAFGTFWVTVEACPTAY